MTPTLSLTDRATWVGLLTIVAAALSDIFHRSFAGWVPAAATLAAGLVVAFTILAKHHYQAALAATAAVADPHPAIAAQATIDALLNIAQQALQAAQSAPAPQPAPAAVPAAPAASGSPPAAVPGTVSPSTVARSLP